VSFTIHDVEQRTEAWSQLHAGLVTGSRAQPIIAVRKKGSGELAIRRDLRNQLVVECLTGRVWDKTLRPTESLQHGIDTEPDAIAAYEAATGCIVQRVGFISHNTMRAGCSPDGYVGEWEGVVECKCPDSTTHLEYLKHGVVPEDYSGQVIHTLWLTGAAWLDFVSFDPRFQDPRLQLFIKRTRRDEVDIAAYELALAMFLTEVDREVAALAA
jgi:hypothetical protein